MDSDAVKGQTIDELAAVAGVPTSTIRYYQGMHLLPPPQREGRVGLYNPGHLRRIQQIRRLQERGFSLAAIREILNTRDVGGSIRTLVAHHHPIDDAQELDIHAMVEEIFPDEGIDAPPIQTAIALGVLRIENTRLTVTDEAIRPLAVAILRLFQLGIPTQEALRSWAAVQSHAHDLAQMFASLAESHIYPKHPRSRRPDIFLSLVEAATELLTYAFYRALMDEVDAAHDDPN